MGAELKFELTNQDRKYLQRMVAAPGYKVLQKIVAGFVGTLEDRAIAVSKVDPLRHQETIAKAWAYHSIGEMFEANLAAAIQFEVDLLTKPVLAKMTIAEREERHRKIVLGELDVIPEEENEN